LLFVRKGKNYETLADLLLALTMIRSLSSCFLCPKGDSRDFAVFTAPDGAAHTGTLVVANANITQSLTVYYPAYHDYTWSGMGKDGVVMVLTA
jgi:hypothetical protein